MKKFNFLFLFLFIIVLSCKDQTVNPIDPYQQQLKEFNASSGFNARLVFDTSLVNEARSWQGHGDYPGVDDWFAVEINFGAVVLGGLPGQSAFYSILETYYISNGNKERYWKLLQVKPHPVFGYRPMLGCYQINENHHAAISRTLANPEYGNGGGWQLYIKNYDSTLTRFAEINLSDSTSVE